MSLGLQSYSTKYSPKAKNMRLQGGQGLLQFICILRITESYEFPASLADWCQYSSFCDHEGKAINVSKGFETCCRSCSCDSDCGRNRNCCFYKDDNYRIEEKGETSCVVPILINNSDDTNRTIFYDKQMIHIGRYFMINKCPGAQDTCRSIHASGWGNLFPHLSYNTGLIYYNQFCARCHNERHVVPWTLAVNCPPFEYGLPSLNSYSYEIQKLLADQNSKCILIFHPPEDIDLSSEFCHLDIIQECTDPYPSTEIDTFLKLEEQCHRFNAPFAISSFQSQVFRNVYCFLCSKPKYYETRKILDICIANNYNDIIREIRPGNLVVILGSYDTDYYVTQEKVEELVCHIIRKDDCRPLSCPEGQLRWNNTCEFPQNFVANTFSIIIKLEPFDIVIPKEVMGFLDNVKGQDLLRHGLNEWELELFKVVNNASSDGFKYFVARLYKLAPERSLQHILTPIRQALDNIWQLNCGNISIHLTPSFNDFITISGSYKNKSHFSVFYEEEVQNHMFVETMIRLSKVQKIQSPSLIITKSYFCNQVDLFDGEYVDYEYQVYLRSVNETLGNGKFRRLQTSDGNVVIRVCYDDIGQEWINKSISNRASTGISDVFAFGAIVGIGASFYMLNL